MKTLWCLVVLLSLFIATEALAARVYLKDGSVVECQSFWSSKGTVYVKVNRDVLLEFAPDEVNVKKTFSKRPVKKKVRAAPVKEEQAALSAPVAGQTDKQASPDGKPVTPTGVQTTPGSPNAAAGKPEHATAGQVKPVSPPTVAATTGAGTVTPAPSTAAPVAKPSPPAVVPSQPAQATQPSAPSTPDQSVSPRPIPRQITPVSTPPMTKPSALGAGLSVAVVLVPLLLLLIILAAMWRVFEKAGEAGWKAIVPIYNLFVLVKIAGKPWWWFLLIVFVPLIGLIFYLLTCLALAQKFSKSPLYGVLLCFFGFIMFPLLAFDDSTYSG